MPGTRVTACHPHARLPGGGNCHSHLQMETLRVREAAAQGLPARRPQPVEPCTLLLPGWVPGVGGGPVLGGLWAERLWPCLWVPPSAVVSQAYRGRVPTAPSGRQGLWTTDTVTPWAGPMTARGSAARSPAPPGEPPDHGPPGLPTPRTRPHIRGAEGGVLGLSSQGCISAPGLPPPGLDVPGHLCLGTCGGAVPWVKGGGSKGALVCGGPAQTGHPGSPASHTRAPLAPCPLQLVGGRVAAVLPLLRARGPLPPGRALHPERGAGGAESPGAA